MAGELAGRNYRFDEAVELTRRSLALDGRNWRAQGDLGSHLLRTGDEPAAYQALDASFKADGYNKLVLNLLTMMDALEKFVTVKDGDLVVRMHKDEAPVLQEYAVPLAHQALSTMASNIPKTEIHREIGARIAVPKNDFCTSFAQFATLAIADERGDVFQGIAFQANGGVEERSHGNERAG